MRPRNVPAMSLPEEATDEDDALNAFLACAAPGLAALARDDLAEGNLSLRFALSAWLRMARVSVAGACSSLLELREALVEVAGLDAASEPIPLMAGDARTALVALAVYLYELIQRAAARAGTPAATVVHGALASLGATHPSEPAYSPFN